MYIFLSLPEMKHLKSKLGPQGRVVLPSKIRELLEVEVGDDVVFKVENGNVHILSRMAAIRNSQKLVVEKINEGTDLSFELKKLRESDGV